MSFVEPGMNDLKEGSLLAWKRRKGKDNHTAGDEMVDFKYV